MEFIDLYAGVGGWSLGLGLAGHDCIRSCEIWPTANAARTWNLGGDPTAIDMRVLDPVSLPSVPLLVGSPPCTQFSYANRGGNGDIADGLRDLKAFLDCVRVVRPRHWLLENVPRVASVLERELATGGALESYADLFENVHVLDMSDFGVPQRRKRCIAGRFPFELLLSYAGVLAAPTLGQVIESIERGRDLSWETDVPYVTDHARGDVLSWEEERVNREKKTFHPIYNNMSFPDDGDRPSRTVTATCTRVSRESIVVPAGGGFRLLTVREAAALQSFPLTYQFPSPSRGARLRMAGNAVPPLFTYLVGMAAAGVRPENLLKPHELPLPQGGPCADAAADRASGRRHKQDRAFRAAIPGLRFKSGMSFELRNRFDDGMVRFEVAFNGVGLGGTEGFVPDARDAASLSIGACPFPCSEESMQDAWVATQGTDHPFYAVDALGEVAVALAAKVPQKTCEAVVVGAFKRRGMRVSDKALRHACAIAAGVAVAATFNASRATMSAAA